MTEIVQKGTQVLREKARAVELTDISSDYIQDILSRMSAALHKTTNGVALAAPQIGESLRIFIVSGALFSPRNSDGEIIERHPDLIFINPVLTHKSQKTEWVDEGCLSVEYMQGEVERSTEATIEAYDETGRHFSMDGSGLLAQIFQHETEHLDGILFVDKAQNLEQVPPEAWS